MYKCIIQIITSLLTVNIHVLSLVRTINITLVIILGTLFNDYNYYYNHI